MAQWRWIYLPDLPYTKNSQGASERNAITEFTYWKNIFFSVTLFVFFKKKTSTHVAVVPKKRSALNTHFKRYYAKKIFFLFPFHDALDPLCPFAEGEKE
jgi:hypothetical protein